MLGGKANGIGSFFMRFAECITIYRSGCDAGYDDTGKYIEAKRKKLTDVRGIITDKKRRTVQDASGERIEGSLNYRAGCKVYASSEDDIGAADIIYTDGSFWKVMAADPEGCDTVGSAILLSDDECFDLGICR